MLLDMAPLQLWFFQGKSLEHMIAGEPLDTLKLADPSCWITSELYEEVAKLFSQDASNSPAYYHFTVLPKK